jgi:hypothetical protein
MSSLHNSIFTWLFISGFKTEGELLEYYNLHSDAIWAAVAFDPSQSYVNSLPDDVLYDLRVARLYPDALSKITYYILLHGGVLSSRLLFFNNISVS